MTRQIRHVRILAFPFADSFQSAQLDALYEEMHGQRRDFIVDYRELRLSTPATLINCDGRPCEHVQGHYLPRRLRCSDVGWLKCTGLYTRLDEVPLDHGARNLRGTLYWLSPGAQGRGTQRNGYDRNDQRSPMGDRPLESRAACPGSIAR